MESYKVIATGSTGNAVLYGSILVDIGVSYKKIEEYKNNIQIVLLTHEHCDHINTETLKRLCFERPSLRVGACKWMKKKLEHLHINRALDLYDCYSSYDYGAFKIEPVELMHDVQNCGYKIRFENGFKVFHATDTNTLDHITAKNFDLYGIEHNYNKEELMHNISTAKKNGEFFHGSGSISTHLSEEAAADFFYENKKGASKLIRLHESKSNL